MYHPYEVAKLERLTEQYKLGLLTAEDFIVGSIDVLESELRREAAMVKPGVQVFA